MLENEDAPKLQTLFWRLFDSLPTSHFVSKSLLGSCHHLAQEQQRDGPGRGVRQQKKCFNCIRQTAIVTLLALTFERVHLLKPLSGSLEAFDYRL